MRARSKPNGFSGRCHNCGEPVMTRNVYQPIEGCVVVIDGVETILNTGHFFREGHPVLEQYPQLFRPVRVSYDVEQATAAPGKVRA